MKQLGVSVIHRISNEIPIGENKEENSPWYYWVINNITKGKIMLSGTFLQCLWIRYMKVITWLRKILMYCPEEWTQSFWSGFSNKTLMRWKALGYDEITEKMILAENGRTTPILPKQFFRIWNEETKLMNGNWSHSKDSNERELKNVVTTEALQLSILGWKYSTGSPSIGW